MIKTTFDKRDRAFYLTLIGKVNNYGRILLITISICFYQIKQLLISECAIEVNKTMNRISKSKMTLDQIVFGEVMVLIDY